MGGGGGGATWIGLPAHAFEPTSDVGHAGIVRDALESFEYELAEGQTLRFAERAIREDLETEIAATVDAAEVDYGFFTAIQIHGPD